MVAVTLALIIATAGYLVAAAVLSLRRVDAPDAGEPLNYLFVVPCLNEELVIANTLDSLMALPSKRTHVLVVDDGSTDGTSAVVARYPTERVTILRRDLPHARQGKGAALNAAFRWAIPALFDQQLDRVVLAIVDADGRVEPDVLDKVDPMFADDRVGAVQLMVRILNRDRMITRFQDFEFVSFSTIVQQARENLGSVGLGGNGQFARVSALADLGEDPWTDCLTEDLDLGLRLAVAGWRNRFTADTAVSQQGVQRVRPLLRQRTRWLHGHLQCWRLAPTVFRSDLPNRTCFDLLYYLAAPLILLAASVLFTIPLVTLAVTAATSGVSIGSPAAAAVALAVWYVFAFGPVLLLGIAYWRRAGDVTLVRAMVLAHLLVVYNYVWYAAAWRALARVVTRRGGWAKTARSPEQPSTEPPTPLFAT